MFEVGKKYALTMLEASDGDPLRLTEVTYQNNEVVEVNMPLVKFRQHSREVIINTSGPRFVKAT